MQVNRDRHSVACPFFHCKKREEETMQEQETGKVLQMCKKQDAAGMEKQIQEAMAHVEKIKHGVIELETPIMSQGEEVKELEFDFSKVTPAELTDTMDRHVGVNIAQISPEQQLAVFALSVRGYKGLDEKDLERLCPEDVMACVMAGGQYMEHLEATATIGRLIAWKEGENPTDYNKKGSMRLQNGITVKGADYQALPYDFTRMQGSKYVEVLSATSKTKAGFSYRQALKLYLEAVKTANKWDDATAAEALKQFTVEDVFSGLRVAIAFFLTAYLGARKRMNGRS
jgi:hypothetical protein